MISRFCSRPNEGTVIFIFIDRMVKSNACNSGVLSASTMVYVLTALSLVVLISTVYVNSHLNSLLSVSKRIHSYVSMYIGIDSKATVTSNNYTDGHALNLTTSSVRRATSPLATTPGGTTARPDGCKSCFKHDFDFILNNENVCQTDDSAVKVIVLISTTHQNAEKRKAIRETWVSPYIGNRGPVRYMFLLGMISDKALQVALETESASYRDILQEDFVDSYNNLTLKTMMAFRWASKFCQKAEFVMKTDDDMFVNINGLLRVVDQHRDVLQRSVGGFCVLAANPIRDKGSKWYASETMYPQRKYPGYCSGTGYVTSMSVTQRVFDISKHVPFFHLEDIFVGLCIKKIGFAFTRIGGFNANFIPISCSYKQSVITSHGVNPKQMRQAWDLKC